MKKIIAAVKAISSGFNDLINFIQTIFKILGNLLQQIVYLFKYLTQAITVSSSFISTLPNWLAVFATVTISISVLYMILGRKGGAD